MNKLNKSLEIMLDILSTTTKDDIDKELLELDDGLDCGPTFSEFFNTHKTIEIKLETDLTYLDEDCFRPSNNTWYYPSYEVNAA